MAYTWDSYLETGNPAIDGQHKQLVGMLNDLGEAYAAGKGLAELERALEFLAAYTLKHFADEEQLQVESAYPDYWRHKRYHKDFVAVVTSLATRLHQEGASPELLHEVYMVIGEWLTHHIRGEDFKLAAYLQARGTHAPE